jgi:AcrR family transcriptional regulator
MANADGGADRAPLRAEQRSVADARILEGALAVFAEKGLDGTVDDVAEAAGVSRRTVFRHFASHGELFTAVVAQAFEVYGDELSRLAALDANCEPWLMSTAARVHELNATLLGRGFWDIHVQRSDRAPELAAAISERLGRRMGLMGQLAQAAWQARGGRGAPPPAVVDAFAVMLSAFTTSATQSFHTEDAGKLSAHILSLVLAEAVREQQGQAGHE